MDYNNPHNQHFKKPKRQAVIFLLLTLLVSLGLVAAPQPAMAARPYMVRRNRYLLDRFNELGRGTVPVAADTASAICGNFEDVERARDE